MKKGICIAIIIIFLIMGSYVVVQAVTPSELEQRRIELKKEIQEAGQTIENIDIELTKNLEEINKLDEEIYKYEEQIKTSTENLNKIEKQIKETEEYLKGIQLKYDHQKEVLQKRLLYYYEEGSTMYLDVLLNSRSIVDFISRYYLISEITDYDKSLLDSIEKEKNNIKQIKEKLLQSKEMVKTTKAEQKKATISIENSKVIKNSYINKLTKEDLKIQEEISIYQRELDLIDLEILMNAMQEGDGNYVGGAFAWPAPGYYTITSPYGMRIHPVLKTRRMHTGMDIGAPTGSYAIAANDGIVIKSTYSYSYGNMIMIDHGGGIKTLYAHGSELIAQVGDKVKKGDPIMKIGSTGWSTGPHLHFEIRINGQAIDPYTYVIKGEEN